MQTAAPNAYLQMRGRRCSRRMAHSDPPPPFGVQGVLNALSDSCQFLSDSKSLLWPQPCPPTLCAHSPRGRPKPQLCRFLADSSPFENSSKIKLLERLGAKKLDLGNPLVPAGVPRGARSHQVAPKGVYKSGIGTPSSRSWNRPAAKIALGTLLGTISINFGRMFDGFAHDV